ncbi:glycosyltransferase family 61 protein [Candidatus Dependentiae bacterium]|nr:glycosyltransferase family 61 protein [Candidatus Dependentiae bacterium]
MIKSHNLNLPFTTIQEIMKQNSFIEYHKVLDELFFEYKPFGVSTIWPYRGISKECYVVSIPQAMVRGNDGWIFINNALVKEFVMCDRYERIPNFSKLLDVDIKKYSGSVAVIAELCGDNYFHFLNELLSRLALLEISGIHYDWLYIPNNREYMKAFLKLWGIDQSKIISPDGDDFCIQADMLVIPSFVNNTSIGHKQVGNFIRPELLLYVKNKLLRSIESNNVNSSFSKRVFISRKDTRRRILNEDQVFDFFKAKNFERYELSKMSVIEQIILFSQAEYIVGEHGAGLSNILFCKAGTKVLELFQLLIDGSMWGIAQVNNLDYVPLLLVKTKPDYFVNWAAYADFYFKAYSAQVNVSVEKVQEFVNTIDNDNVF